jgi:hypothetical protein
MPSVNDTTQQINENFPQENFNPKPASPLKTILLIVVGLVFVSAVACTAFLYGKNSQPVAPGGSEDLEVVEKEATDSTEKAKEELPAEVDETSGWKTYSNKTHEYSIRFPADYETVLAKDYANPEDSVAIENKDKKISIGFSTDAWTGVCANSSSCEKTRSMSITLIGKSYSTEEYYMNKDYPYATYSFQVEEGITTNKKTTLYLKADYGKPNDYEEIFQILSTFKFTDSADETAGWKTYADPNKYFSFQYPPSWTLKNGFDSKTDTAVYDSADMKEWPTNGGSTVSWPAHFLDIFSIEVTSRTAEQEADEYEKSWNVTDAQLNRISVNKNGVDFEFYDLEGENAVRYRNVAISNGKFLIKASSSIDKIGDGSIESQILSTFKFLE